MPFQFASNSKNFLLTNFWTYARHGHAKSELTILSDFISRYGFHVKTLILQNSLCPRIILSPALVAHELRFDHARLFKTAIDRSLSKEVLRMISRQSVDNSTITPVLISSAKIKHLEFSLSKFNFHNPIAIRLLDEPKNEYEWDFLSKIKRKSQNHVIFATGAKDFYERLFLRFNDSLHAPEALSLKFEKNEVNSGRHRLGIFWPVGRSANLNEVTKILEITKTFQPIVKLPNQASLDQFKKDFPEISFVKSVTSDSEFGDILASIKTVILGHTNYINQTSGYANYFLANGVPIIAKPSNSFFTDLESFGNFYELHEDLNGLSELLYSLFKRENNTDITKFHSYSINQWHILVSRLFPGVME